MPTLFADLQIGCACYSVEASCVCPGDEKVLRHYSAAHLTNRPMTAGEREWCLSEIALAEGYERADYVNSSDADLARVVLAAWTDYCRDKGLL